MFPENILHCLRDTLMSVAAKWYQIGLKLKLDSKDLHSVIESALQASKYGDYVKHLEEMLKQRLEAEEAEPLTWKEIVLDESALADQVGKEHGKPDHT